MKSSMVNKSTKFNNDKEEARDLLKRSTEQMVKDILEVKDGGQGRCVFLTVNCFAVQTLLLHKQLVQVMTRLRCYITD